MIISVSLCVYLLECLYNPSASQIYIRGTCCSQVQWLWHTAFPMSLNKTRLAWFFDWGLFVNSPRLSDISARGQHILIFNIPYGGGWAFFSLGGDHELNAYCCLGWCWCVASVQESCGLWCGINTCQTLKRWCIWLSPGPRFIFKELLSSSRYDRPCFTQRYWMAFLPKKKGKILSVHACVLEQSTQRGEPGHSDLPSPGSPQTPHTRVEEHCCRVCTNVWHQKYCNMFRMYGHTGTLSYWLYT
jgi:hypothetical protein